MHRSIVRPALRRGPDHQSLIALCDLQRAFILRDRVVVSLEVRAFRVYDRVRYFAFGYRRYAAGRLDVGRFAFNKSVSAYRYIGLRKRRAVVRLLAALARQRYATLIYAQRSNIFSYIAIAACVGQYIGVSVVLAVACVIVLHAFRRRSNRHCVACAQREDLASAVRRRLCTVVRYCVHFISVHRSIVRPALRRGPDHQSLIALCDLQRAFILRDRVVVSLEVRAFRVYDRVRYFAFGYRRYAAGRLDVGRFAFNKSVSAYRYIGLRKRRAVVRLLAALARQCYATRIDRQLSSYSRDRVVCSHVLFAVHHLVARRDRVVARRSIRHVRHTTSRFRYQLVAFQQLAARYRYFGILMRAAVICPFIDRCRDRDRHARVRHRQLTVHLGYGVVACRAARELIARYNVINRALTRERDAARHGCSDLIAAYQAFYIILRPTLRFACVCERLVLRRYSHSLRCDRQCTGSICYGVVGRNTCDRSLLTCRQIILRAFVDIGDRGGSTERCIDSG